MKRILYISAILMYCCTASAQTGYSELGYFAIVKQQSALPVTLLHFNAAKKDKAVLLAWETTAAINSSHFTIERSGNGVDFTVLNTVQSAANSSIKQQYQLLDNYPFNGKNYYRLAQYDLDGKYVRYPVKMVDMGNGLVQPLVVYPNPVLGNTVYISTGFMTDVANIVITSMSGKKIYNGKPTAGNRGVYTIVLAQKPAEGCYFISLSSKDILMTGKMIVF